MDVLGEALWMVLFKGYYKSFTLQGNSLAELQDWILKISLKSCNYISFQMNNVEGSLSRKRRQQSLQQWLHRNITSHISSVKSRETVLKDFIYFWLVLATAQLDIKAECGSTNSGDTVKCHTNKGPWAVAILANEQWWNMIILLWMWQ